MTLAERDTTLETTLTALLAPVIAPLGYELVRLRFFGGDEKTLQVMAETPAGLCGVEDCMTISRACSEVLDEKDPIPFAYRLEVSSPGIDRPLTRPKDFTRWIGFEVKVETLEPVQGRKRIEAMLVSFENDVIGLDVGGVRYDVPFANMKTAKLMLTDALLAATKPQQEVMADTPTEVVN
jgi:ribosome maturation factor RimP